MDLMIIFLYVYKYVIMPPGSCHLPAGNDQLSVCILLRFALREYSCTVTAAVWPAGEIHFHFLISGLLISTRFIAV